VSVLVKLFAEVLSQEPILDPNANLGPDYIGDE
jgi:hypothetical protein